MTTEERLAKLKKELNRVKAGQSSYATSVNVQSLIEILNELIAALTASDIAVDTANFDNNLSSLDDTIQKALDTIDDLELGGTPAAADVSADTANFDGNLSVADDTVQKALDTLDDMIGGSGNTLSNIGDGAEIVKELVGSDYKIRSIDSADGSVQVDYSGDGNKILLSVVPMFFTAALIVSSSLTLMPSIGLVVFNFGASGIIQG